MLFESVIKVALGSDYGVEGTRFQGRMSNLPQKCNPCGVNNRDITHNSVGIQKKEYHYV